MVSSINNGLAKLYELVQTAKTGNARVGLGFPSWTAYVADVFSVPMRLVLGQRLRIGQHTIAQQICGHRVLAAILADRSRLHAELATTAEALIARLRTAAAIDKTIVELTRERRVDGAHALATVESDYAELGSLYQLRDAFLTPRGVNANWSTGWHSCARFENPWEITDASTPLRDRSQWNAWRAAIRGGGKLWYPTITEAREASRPHEPNVSAGAVTAAFVG